MKRIPLLLVGSSALALIFFEFNIDILLLMAFFAIVIIFSPATIRKLIFICVIFFVCVFYRLDIIESYTTSLPIDSKDVTLQGKIVSFPIYSEERAQFILRLDSPYNEKIQAFVHDNTHEFFYGQRISFKARVKLPDKKRNPGGFDYDKYLRSKGIYAVLYIDNKSVKYFDNEYNPVELIGVKFRNRLDIFIKENFTEREKSFILGLILGDKSIDEDTVSDFNRLGVSHILSVSGLHVAYIYLFVNKIGSNLRLKESFKLIAIGIFLYLYCFIVGFSPSVIRASCMCFLSSLAEILKKKYDTLNSLCLIACVSVIINPFVFYDVGFQLSYSAVMSIAIFYPYLNNKWRFNNIYIEKTKSLLLLTLSVQLGTIPITLYHFHTLSLLSLLANFIIVPLSGFVIVGFLAVFLFNFIFPFPIAPIALIPIKIAIYAILDVSKFLSSLPFASIIQPALPLKFTYIYYIILFSLMGYFYLYKDKNRKILLLFLIPFVVMSFYDFSRRDVLNITYLDVGQGDSALLEIPGGYTVLIDGGGSYNYSVGEKVVLKALLANGIKKIDLAIVTHSHTDHQLGILEIMDYVDISHLIINGLEKEGHEELIKKAEERGVSLYENHHTDVDFGNIKFEFLYPTKEDKYIDINNSSVVLKINYRNHSFLFTGDIESKGEVILLRRNVDLKSDFLKVGHHGSNTSSTEEFLQEVKPKYAIISVGENNIYNHPSEIVLKRLKEKGVEVFRTDENGAIKISSNGYKYSIKTYID